MSPLRLLGFALLTVASLQVSACKRFGDAGSDSLATHGRYVGVGIYTPGAPWAQMARTQPPSDAAAARLADDQAIIVVTDSSTGEIRACGDMSGYCVGTNPWATPMAKSQIAPVELTAHGHPAGSAADVSNSADNDAAPAER